MLCRYILRPPMANERLHLLTRIKDAAEESSQQNGIQELVPKSTPDAERKTRAGVRRRYIPWYELLRRTFGSEGLCPPCGGKLRLIALVKKEETIITILTAMHMPTGPPKVASTQSPVGEEEELELSGGRADEEWLD